MAGREKNRFLGQFPVVAASVLGTFAAMQTVVAAGALCTALAMPAVGTGLPKAAV